MVAGRSLKGNYLFPPWEQNIPRQGMKCSQHGKKGYLYVNRARQSYVK